MIQKALIILLIGWSCSCGHRDNNPTDVTKDSTQSTLSVSNSDILVDTLVNDTMFIERQVTRDYYHAIYIDTTRQSEDFHRLIDFSFSEADTLLYEHGYEYAKSKNATSFRKRNVTNLPKKWLPVYRYKNKYYLYAPCDWGTAGRRMINDSSFVHWDTEGPAPSSLQSIKQSNKTKYVLDLRIPGENHKSIITIYTIDPLTRLSLFEYSDGEGESNYELYVPVENAEDYDMIVNYCPNQKHVEFSFDKIDFHELIGKR